MVLRLSLSYNKAKIKKKFFFVYNLWCGSSAVWTEASWFLEVSAKKLQGDFSCCDDSWANCKQFYIYSPNEMKIFFWIFEHLKFINSFSILIFKMKFSQYKKEHSKYIYKITASISSSISTASIIGSIRMLYRSYSRIDDLQN